MQRERKDCGWEQWGILADILNLGLGDPVLVLECILAEYI